MVEPSPTDTVARLVERFDRNRDAYRAGRYNEAQVRREFIDPLFKALGWDVENERGWAEPYKDVIHEDAIRVGGATKAPDYCFRIGGTRKFFVEAKKPSVDIRSDEHPAYQLRRYAWSAKLPLSILTDFEEFAAYDCRVKPARGDRASTARTLYVGYQEYLARWAEIARVFSREAVLTGSFDRYVGSARRKRGTAEVDDAFLADIEQWRDALARNIALRNPSLSQRELNFAVTRTIDRVIFLRMCEDRGIETYGQLLGLTGGDNIYPRLVEIYRRADERYNSGLFHFAAEAGRPEPPDELTPGLTLDDKVLKSIIANLYYPDSPYEFSVLPAEILGHVYEQFLGKVITLTPSHRARVEEKPEVRKAGGVYYTPTYIVHYIVKYTVGELLKDKTPQQVAGVTDAWRPSKTRRPLAILDPACGSGSFLIGAYQYLLEWHLEQYRASPDEHAAASPPRIFEGPGGDWRLTTAEKKRILLANIYGVDIDPQAVEVTKLSLLLKVLEGETGETVGQTLAMFHERALPDLAGNIKCGNSLIGPDFYDDKQMGLFDEDARWRINAFDWQAEFPHIFPSPSGRGSKGEGAAGFDVVIGNPPYRMLQPHNTDQGELAYLRDNYLTAKFKIELFHMFLQRGISLLQERGYHGYIVPTTLLNNVYAETLRRWLMDRCAIQSISVARGRVFENADVHTSVILLRRESNTQQRMENRVATTSKLSPQFVQGPSFTSEVRQDRFLELPGSVWNIQIDEENVDLIMRLITAFTRLGDIAEINRGLITGRKEEFFFETKRSKSCEPIIAGADVQRYFISPPSQFVLFERPDSAGGCWDAEMHLAPHKVVIRQIGARPTASLLAEPIAVTGNIFAIRTGRIEQEMYLLGALNSRLVNFFWQIMFADFKQSFPQVTIFSLSQVPIRVVDPDSDSDVDEQNRVVELVERMLNLRQQLARCKTAEGKSRIQRDIEIADRQIDRLVYSLYGLTEAEIRIVEGAASRE